MHVQDANKERTTIKGPRSALLVCRWRVKIGLVFSSLSIYSFEKKSLRKNKTERRIYPILFSEIVKKSCFLGHVCSRLAAAAHSWKRLLTVARCRRGITIRSLKTADNQDAGFTFFEVTFNWFFCSRGFLTWTCWFLKASNKQNIKKWAN